MYILINNTNYHLKKMLVAVCIFAVSYLLFCCSEKHPPRNVERSFYYWKSIFKLTDFEKKRLDSLQVKTIYLKFFDVDWNDEIHQPIPKAQVRIIDTVYLKSNKIKIIPAVFITNECIQKINTSQVNELAGRIVLLVKNIQVNSLPGLKINEVQIDCDWSSSTKEKYFSLLTSIKNSGFPNLSATIRLHQVKFSATTGVPPVAKGLLMCYNMGNLKDPATKNSIIEIAELKKYAGNLGIYPLPLDVGLPLFDWYVLVRKNKYKGLVKSIDTYNTVLSATAADQFIFLKDTILNDIEFKKDDLLRREKSEYNEVVNAAAFISSKLKNSAPSLALFHLDSVTLKKFSTHELENIYNSLH